MFHTTQEIAADMTAAGIARAYADRLAEQARPAVWLETRAVEDEAEIALGATKFGGRPDLPKGAAWPVRAAYPNAAETAQRLRDKAASSKSWSWAKPENRDRIRRETLEHAQRVETAQPLSFVAQINFAEMWAAGPLDPDFPQQGLLSLFYDLEEMLWGFDPQHRPGFAVLFHDTGSGQLARQEKPAAMRDGPAFFHLPPLACTAHACMTPLPLPTAQYDALGLPEAFSQQLWDDWYWSDDRHDHNDLQATENGENSGCHRVGGWPTPIQGDMQIQCALVRAGHYCGNSTAYEDPHLQAIRATATDWLLLAQIGTDEKGGLTWEDDGQLYLWIRRDDLVARRFENAHLVLQCH